MNTDCLPFSRLKKPLSQGAQPARKSKAILDDQSGGWDFKTYHKLDFGTFSHPEMTKEEVALAFGKVLKGKMAKMAEKKEEDLDLADKMEKVKSQNNHVCEWFQWFHGAVFGVGQKNGTGKELVLNLSGQGLETMRKEFDYFESEILHHLAVLGFKATRLDFAIDIHTKKPWDEFIHYLQAGFYSTRAEIMDLRNIKTRRVQGVYIGSMANREILICCYDKRLEQNKKAISKSKKAKKKLEDLKLKYSPWYRFETRFYNGTGKAAAIIFRTLTGTYEERKPKDKSGYQNEKEEIDEEDEAQTVGHMVCREKIKKCDLDARSLNEDARRDHWQRRDGENARVFKKRAKDFFKLIDESEFEGMRYKERRGYWEKQVEKTKGPLAGKIIWERLKNVQRLKISPLWDRLFYVGNSKICFAEKEAQDLTNFDKFALSYDQQAKRTPKRLLAMMTELERQIFYKCDDQEKVNYLTMWTQRNAKWVLPRIFKDGIERFNQKDRDELEDWIIPTRPEEESTRGLKKNKFYGDILDDETRGKNADNA